MTYMKGDPDDGLQHRRAHAKWAAVAYPKPDLRFAAVADPGGLVAVDRASPRWMREAMYKRAVHFKQEFRYDFVQWSVDERDGPDRCVGFLFVAEDGETIAGACAFRWREYTGAPHAWTLQWIWLAKPFRRSGILTRHWPAFVERFGTFDVERPLSEAMRGFLRKVGAPGGETGGGGEVAALGDDRAD